MTTNLEEQSDQANTKIDIESNAPMISWVVFDENWDVVRKGVSKDPDPFRLTAGSYLFECHFGGPAATTASATITTTNANSPFPQPPFVSSVPTQGGTETFPVGFKV